MANKVVKNSNGSVSVRIDGAYTTNEKHLINVYTDDEGKGRYFGSFKFFDTPEAKKTLKAAVKELNPKVDTIFEGDYPRWVNDEYGTQLRIQNKVKFYTRIGSQEQLPDLEIRDHSYALELTLSETKDGGVFMFVPRAFSIGEATRGNDELFEDDLPF